MVTSTDFDDAIHLWDVETGQEIRIFEGHTGWITSASFSPDSTTLASGSADGTIHLWDIETGKQLQILEGHTGEVYSVAFSPDGSTLASGGNDAEYVNLGQLLHEGSALASGGEDTVRLWDVATGKQFQTLEGHTNSVVNVSFSPDSDDPRQ